MEHLSKTFFSETSLQFLKSMMEQVLKVSPSRITWDYKETAEKYILTIVQNICINSTNLIMMCQSSGSVGRAEYYQTDLRVFESS